MENPADEKGNPKRIRLLLALAVVFAAAGSAAYFYWNSYARFYETTDDAYVAGNIINVDPQTAGTVTSISADNTDTVAKGQALVRLDDSDAVIALEKAKTELAAAVNLVRGYRDRVEAARANVALKNAELERARSDYNRRKSLFEKKVLTDEALEHASTDLRSSQKAADQAEHQLREAMSAAGSGGIEDHTSVRLAKDKLRDAWLALRRTVIPSPASGVVARRSVEVGQRVAPGRPLMAVIPLDQVWVEANFKENQLKNVRVNQPVEMRSDMYGDGLVFHGSVEGIGAGSGAVFSIIPPQNASGNWIKIVQRVPVRISLDKREIAKNPLLLGLSVKVVVDAHDTGGPAISRAREPREIYKTDVYENAAGADELIRRIISQNLAGCQGDR
ncbi:MAG: efflux RND transporter periplasmic adaptor subunit [Nitrospinae bacterium]|nr:efflux RND transporter periplasmic adaptor subunit [Nitrospinota bacterium]